MLASESQILTPSVLLSLLSSGAPLVFSSRDDIIARMGRGSPASSPCISSGPAPEGRSSRDIADDRTGGFPSLRSVDDLFSFSDMVVD